MACRDICASLTGHRLTFTRDRRGDRIQTPPGAYLLPRLASTCPSRTPRFVPYERVTTYVTIFHFFFFFRVSRGRRRPSLVCVRSRTRHRQWRSPGFRPVDACEGNETRNKHEIACRGHVGGGFPNRN